MIDDVIVEVALHELVSKAANPNVPYGPDEVAADAAQCVAAGATFLHFHARDAESGAQRWHDDTVYAATVGALRDAGVPEAVPWYPTYPGVRPGVPVRESMRHLAALVDAGIGLELAAIDVGSGNLSAYDRRHHEFTAAESVKQLPHALFREFTDFCRAIGVRPYLGIYEPGHLRHLAAYLDAGWIEPPLVVKCFFSEHHPYGLPPVPRSVEMTAELIDVVLAGVERTWFVQCYGRGILDLALPALDHGAHLRIGLGDLHPWEWDDADPDRPTNRELVERAMAIVDRSGRGRASIAATRGALGLGPGG